MKYVTDTHALVWHLSKEPALSPEIQELFRKADVGEAVIFVSVITLIEMIYLGEKGKVPKEICDHTLKLLGAADDRSYRLVPLDHELGLAVSSVPREAVPEMPDRIIAATAYHLKLPLITKDKRIHEWGGIASVW